MRLLSCTPLVASLLAPPLAAQTPCAPAGGPDLVVHDLNAVVNYAALGNLEALALGKIYCNVGATWANCFTSTNQHPLAAPGLFRLKTVAGTQRLEQVGIGWVFHGYFALSGANCCSDCQPTDGNHVGVHCSDANTASASGTQSNLGPRWQVDAFTGTFPYPPANPPYTGGVARRLAVDVADLEPTGGGAGTRYFGELLMVAPDEAAAGNAHNNASHRELNVSGGGSAWSFAVAGTTQREQPAILAWPLADPAVQTSVVQIPGEGRLILAWKTTALGNGVFHYEYALYNLNSADAVGSFEVPIGPGVSATSAGFHDVAHRDGDGIGSVDQDGTDWPAVLGGGALAWATDSFASNPNANALRWGTLYNFRFDSDAAPTPGTLTIGLFQSGASLSVPADVPLVVGTPGCFGDGSAGACPCANFGSSSNGCANSSVAAGAHLEASGATLADPVTGTDTLVLHASGMPATATGIYLQGSTLTLPGAWLGDGLRCAGGLLKRLAVKPSSGGASQFPAPGDPSVSQRSAQLGDPLLGSGVTRHHQVWYRDNVTAFCPDPPGRNYNATNAVSVDW